MGDPLAGSRGAISQFRPDRPQVGERRPEQRAAQVFSAGAAAGPALRPDGALDHLHVTVPPLLHALVQVDEPLAHAGDRRVVAVDVDQDALDLGRRLDGPRDVALELRPRHVVAAAREVMEERIPDRGATVPRLQEPARRALLRVVSDRALVLLPERELERAELEGLEPAAGLEAVAEREELERRHGL